MVKFKIIVAKNFKILHMEQLIIETNFEVSC